MKKTNSHFNMYVDAKEIKIDDSEDSVKIVISAKILEASDFDDRIPNTVTIHNKNIIPDL